jgi:DNA-binding NarL/FixJ family response regulator
LVAVLGDESQVRVLECGLAPGGLESVVARHSPSVVIVDEAIEYALLERLKSFQPAPGVVVVVSQPSSLYGRLLLAAGVTCIDQAASTGDILAAVQSAARGEHSFVRADGGRIAPSSPTTAVPLTPSETKVFGYLRLGWSYAKIGRALHISPETARKHTTSICRKLNVNSRLELIGTPLLVR